jgi:hypothetical protein
MDREATTRRMARRRRPSAPPRRPGPPPPLEWPRSLVAVRRAGGPFGHVTLELDVAREHFASGAASFLGSIASALREREVESTADLLELVGGALVALAPLGYRSVDHWEAHPGGWLPLPEPTHASLEEPVSHLVRALGSGAWRPLARSHTFGVRLSGPKIGRIDLTVRRVHRERTHAITAELWGRLKPPTLVSLVRDLHARIPLDRAEVTAAEPVGRGDAHLWTR